ncbi:ER to Golgi transport-related protein [Pseudohyphozyma bogoriensis]|nr:ER to Golgi transport-related protein [Pseudohyphozyma bogoriensis]
MAAQQSLPQYKGGYQALSQRRPSTGERPAVHIPIPEIHLPPSYHSPTRILVYVAAGIVGVLALLGIRSVVKEVWGPEVAVTGAKKMVEAMRNAPSVSSDKNVKEPVCVIARTYGAQIHYLPIFLLALWNSGLEDVRVFLLNTDKAMKTKHLRKASEFVNHLTGRRDFATFLDWPITTTGDYGYALTDQALLYFYDHPELNCEYLVLTNGDNLYSQTLGEMMKPWFEKKTDLMGINFVSHHKWRNATEEFDGDKTTSVEPGTSVTMFVDFKPLRIDLGAAIFRYDMLRRNNLTFGSTGGYGWFSDGQFIEKAHALSTSAVRIHEMADSDQYISILRKHDSRGFSTDISGILIVANITRIFYWLGDRFQTYLLVQSMLMVLAQFSLLYICLLYRDKSTGFVDPRSEAEIDALNGRTTSRRPGGLWQWKHFGSYLEFTALLILFHSATFLIFHSFNWYVTGLGFIALGLEATLPLPQLAVNFERKSTAGFRHSVLAGWLAGDCIKTIYFFVTPDNSIAFKACSCFQLSVDVLLCIQTWMYRKQTAIDIEEPLSAMKLPVLALLLSLVHLSSALYFYLEAGENKCFLEELPKDTIVVGHYKAEEWAESSKSYVVNDQLGIQIVVQEVESGDKVVNTRGLPQGKFTFTSHEAGDHQICLRSNYTGGWFSTPQVRMHLDIAVGEAKVDEEGEREHVKDLAGKVKELNNRLADIRREQQFQREREAEFRALSERINSRAMWWSVLQMGVLFGTCAWQLRHLRMFFESKKLR